MNPTTAPPTASFPEWSATASTPAALATCIVPVTVAGPLRDVTSNTLGVLSFGALNEIGTGHPASLLPTGFTGGGRTDPCLRINPGCGPQVFTGRGTSSYPRTVWGVFRPREHGQISVVPVSMSWFGVGISGGGTGIGVQTSPTGVISVGDYFNGSVNLDGTTAALTNGHWYLIAMTFTSATGRILQVYDYTTQAYVTTQSTGSVYSNSGANPYDTADCILGMNDYMFDFYCGGVTADTFAPGTNTYFAQLVADPNLGARGSAYTPSGALTAPLLAYHDSTSNSVTVRITRPTGGTTNAYQYRLHRLPTTATTPSSATAATGYQTSPLLVDTAATSAFAAYVVEVTDGTTTVYTAQIFAHATAGDFYAGLIADSRGVWAQFLGQNMRANNRQVAIVDYHLGGSAWYSPNPQSSWQPNTTQDPVHGQSGVFNLS